MKTFKQYLIEKPLTPSQRIARSRQMKRLMPKIQKKREIAMRKKASSAQLKMRAQKKATTNSTQRTEISKQIQNVTKQQLRELLSRRFPAVGCLRSQGHRRVGQVCGGSESG